MALIESLLTAMVRADGDALVMHVGERPYVVVSTGTLDLSTQILNLDAMTGMLQQLLPSAAQDSLEEFGAVEHRLPPYRDDGFTVVAARGGDDIWIEIRRRRQVAAVAVAEPAPLATPAAIEPPAASEHVPVAEPAVEAPPAVRLATTVEPIVVEEFPAATVEPVVVEELPVAEMVAVVEPVIAQEPPMAEMVAATEPVIVEEPPVAEMVAAVGPAIVDEPPVVELVSAVEPVVVEPLVVELVAAVEPVVMAESPVVAAATVEPVVAEVSPVVELVAALEPAAEEEPTLVDELPEVAEAKPLADDLHATDSRQAIESLEGLLWPPTTSAPPVVAAESMAAEERNEMPVAAELLAASESAAELVAPAASTLTERAPVLQMTRTVRIEVPPRASTVRGSSVERLLRLAASRAASALFVTSESRPSIRVEGDLRPLDGESLMTRADVESAVMEVVPEEARDAVGRGESAEWITEFADLGRVRCITFTDHHGPGAVFRMIATRPATAEQLGLSREVQALATEPQGLVLIAGLPGSGRSTLVSALVDLVNRQRAEYVVTLERQVRLVHDNHSAIVSQREIRGGADEALTAARAALREDPDVLVVDDLASAPMLPLLLQAASEGLVFVSITAPSTTEAVERFIDLAAADMRAGVRAALAERFRGAVAQVLLKKSGGGRLAAREVLLATAAVTRVISDGAPGQLQSTLEGGRQQGMVPLTDALVCLVQSGVVDIREAFRKSPDRTRLVAGLKREGIDTAVVERLA